MQKILHPPVSKKVMQAFPNDRVLAAMSKCIFRAGFSWSVIYNKWPDFEKAFYGFKIGKLLSLDPEEWENYILDTRIVRNRQKITSVYDNAVFIHEISQEHGSFGQFIAKWPDEDQVGLLTYLKKHGSRLGGQTGMYLLRMLGKDSFLLSQDVMQVLVHECNLDVPMQPVSQRDFIAIQNQFIAWKKETKLSFTHLSQLTAYSTGQNYDQPTTSYETGRWNEI
ncbi:MAG: DNA-3-methyladenine glycosylase I [Bdellovibrionota bacterium]